MSDTDDLMRKKFDEMAAERDAILAKSGPLRAKRDKVLNDAKEKARSMDVEIKRVEARLFDIQMGLGRLGKAMGGRSMSDTR